MSDSPGESSPRNPAMVSAEASLPEPDHLDQLPACPVCGGHLIDIRQKRQCERCHTICETCCEGGRG